MRWRNGFYIFAAEILSAALSIVVGVLSNVLTNEKHPERAVVLAIIVFGISSAALQTVRYMIAERQARSSDKALSDIRDNTNAILIHQQESEKRADGRTFDEELSRFVPEIHSQWIKQQWQADPSGVTRLMRALYDPTTRPRDVVSEWQAQKPSWFDSLSSQALLVGAELANSYDGTDLSVDLFIAATTSGSTRRHYWISRAALLRYFENDRPSAQRIQEKGGVDSGSLDKLAQIVVALVMDDGQRANDLLAAWNPETPIDTLLSANIRASLIISTAAASPASPTPNFARIAAIHREAIQSVPFSANPKRNLSATLITMAANGQSANRHSDLQEAVDLAIQARDICRRQRSSSIDAVILACQAAYSDGQFSKVIDIGTVVTGQAIPEEAESDLVRYFVASAALLKGQATISDDLIPLIEDPFRKAWLTASSAEVSGHASASLWREALALARDAPERAQALLGLARMGISESADINEVARVSPEQATLIRAVAAASSGSPGSSIQALRSLEVIDLNSATALANAYIQVGNVRAAIEVLRESAQALNEPLLRFEAAQILWREDLKNEARAELEELLVASGSNQNLRHDALALLGQWAADEGQFATAQARFQDLLALDPEDSKVRWAVILAMLRQGFISDARRIYNGAPNEPSIVYPEHARAWMVVKRDDDQINIATLVDEIIRIAGRFPDNEDVQADAIITILYPRGIEQPPLPSAVQARFNDLCDRFFRSWPDSPRLRRFDADDIQSLVQQMEDLVRPTQEEKTLRREIADRLAKNTIPWAFLSAMTGRSYSEVAIMRAAGILPAQHNDPAEQQLCWDAAYAALDKDVVLDISTATVLVELADLSNLIIGKFQRLIISEDERLDAVRAVEFLRGRSTSSWVYDEKNDRGRLVTVPAEVADQNFEKAVKLNTLFQRCRVISVKIGPPLSELKDLATPAWASAIQCAAQSSAPFWCDDVALRAVARSIGISTFSTPALLRVLLYRQEISAAQHESGIRSLIRTMVGDFPPEQIRLSTLTSEYGNMAAPIASIFSRTAAWANPISSYPIWASLLQQVSSFDQAYVADWAYSAVTGITRVQVDADIRRQAGAWILGAAVGIVGDNPDEVARCVIAVRAGMDSTREADYEDDPLGRATKMVRGAIARNAGLANATTYVSRMFATLDPTDRQMVLQALYE